jgi:septal ring factor EnvC (AmiA/AmiB activator)
MNGVAEQLIVSLTTLIAALIPAWVLIRKHKSEDRAVAVSAANDQVSSIFTVYGQIVTDLREEVDRLKSELDEVRSEQQQCEERNAQLEALVAELVARVQCLEGGNNG